MQIELDDEKRLIIEGCDPETNENDRRILFDLTGRRLKPNDFPQEEETDEEEDELVRLEDVLGFDTIGNASDDDADNEGGGTGLGELLINSNSQVD